MNHSSTKKYYDYNMPQDEYITGKALWKVGAIPVITIQPGTDEAIFVKKIKFTVSDSFDMTALDTIVITVNAYDNVPPLEIGMIATGTIDIDLRQILSWCDPAQFVSPTIGTVLTHSGVLEFTPPVYLRSSPTTADSIVIEYSNVAGGVVAGEMIVSYEGWKCLEVNSGLDA